MDKTYDQLTEERAIIIGDKQYGYKNAYTKKSKDDSFRKQAIKGIYSKNMLNQVYFSPMNLQKVQNKVRYNVYKISKGEYQIGEQDETQLQIVMRSIYLQYSRNLDTDIPKQIEKLNEITSDYLVPKIVSNIKQYLKYLNDKNTPYKIMEHPQNVSNAGEKHLRLDKVMAFGSQSMDLFKKQ
jgi:hypothetical protein